MAKKKKQEPMKSCADCIHEDACCMWTSGRMIADESASRCPEHTKLRESAAYHIGKLEGVGVVIDGQKMFIQVIEGERRDNR